MRITIVSTHYAPEPTGNAPYVTKLAEGLAARGHNVRVIAGQPYYPQWRRYPGYTSWRSQERANGVDVSRTRHYIPRKPTTPRRVVSEITAGIRAVSQGWGKPELVLLVSPQLLASALALVRARWLQRVPTAIWVQDLYSRGVAETSGVSRKAQRVMELVESWVMRNADGIAAIHDRFYAQVAKFLPTGDRRIAVIRNWTHVSDSSGITPDRSALGWRRGETVVLHAGNQGMKQGLLNVVEAARLVDLRRVPIRFVLLGDGNQRTALEAAAAGIDAIEFLDPMDATGFATCLASADILLVNELPNVREMSVPSKLTSYFAFGKPVVAATSEGSVTAEEIANSSAGVRVDANDPSALVDAVQRLAGNARLAEQLGRAGKEYSNDVLSEQRAIDLFEQLCTSLSKSGMGIATADVVTPSAQRSGTPMVTEHALDSSPEIA